MTTPQDLELGATVRRLRKSQRYSQRMIADLMAEQGFPMHQTTVAKIERGARPLRVAEASALAHIFKVPPITMFGGVP